MISINYRDGNGDLYSWLTSREKKYALKELPGFWSYCNYVFNLQSSIIGPSFEFKDWDDFLNNRGDYAKMAHFVNYPRAFIRYFQGILCFGVAAVCGVYFPPNEMIEVAFGDHWYPYKILHLYFAMMAVIWVYFAGFCCVEANLIACGFSYTRKTNDKNLVTENFNSVRLISITPIIFGTSFADYGTNWNIQIHNWLKYYVMLRLMDRSKPKGAAQLKATFLTFVASSVWHGTYLGFLIFFVAIAVLEMQGKSFPKLKLTKQLCDVVPYSVIMAIAWLWNMFNMAYFGMAFNFLFVDRCHLMFVNFYYFLHIVSPIVFLATIYLPKVRFDRSAAPADTKVKSH